MGRESYQARVVLGRSAFDEPMRDENGDFILGGQARIHDDVAYTQEWNDRGRPVNHASERQAKQLRTAQNEVLEACGVIVYKDAAKRRKQAAKEVSEDEQLNILINENETGLMLYDWDRTSGDLLTWWSGCLRKRLVTFDAVSRSLSQIITDDFRIRPLNFLFGGLLAGSVASKVKAMRRLEVGAWRSGVDYLQYDCHQSLPTRQEKMWQWVAHITSTLIELPLEFASTLQALGFAVLPQVLLGLQRIMQDHKSLLSATIDPSVVSQIGTVVLQYVVHDYLHHQIGRRLFGLIRQCLPRPYHASKASIKVADSDDWGDDSLEAAVGRSLGFHTERRFYGPQSFWSALPVAFPWLGKIFGNQVDKEQIKQKTLLRSAMFESGYPDDQSALAMLRSDNILTNLEALGVDIEEGFFVEVDQWAGELDSFREDEGEEVVEEIIVIHPDHLISWTGDSRVTEDITSDSNHQTPPSDPQHIPSLGGQHADLPPLTRFGPPLRSPPPTPPNLTPIEVPTPIVPLTPEPGIRRAQSLIEAQAQAARSPESASRTAPRRARRPTETSEALFDENMRAAVSEVDDTRRQPVRHKQKDTKEYRVTRLSLFFVNSLAWHSSAVLTDVLLLPFDIMYYRGLSGLYMGLTGVMPEAAGMGVLRRGWGLLTPDWHLFRSVMLTIGIDCLIRGALWHIGSSVALQSARSGKWGNF